MKWDKHIQYNINKTKYLIYVFAKKKKIHGHKISNSNVFFFHSYINYGIIAWGGFTKII